MTLRIMKTSKREDYAIVLMTALAKEKEYISLKTLSGKYHLPYAFMKQISNDLVSAELLTTKGGSAGGYKLAREPKDINWKEIMVAVSGEPDFAQCVGDKGSCPISDKCPAASAWNEVHDVILKSLEKVKLSDFVK